MIRKKVKSVQPNANGETISRAMYRSRTRIRTRRPATLMLDALPGVPVLRRPRLPAAFGRIEHGEGLPCHQPPGQAVHARVAGVCAQSPIRDEQVADLPPSHAILEPLERLGVRASRGAPASLIAPHAPRGGRLWH